MSSLSADDWGSVLLSVLTDLVNSITAGLGKAQVLRPSGNQLFILASTVPEEVGEAVLIDDSVTGVAWKQQRPVVISDVSSEPHYKGFRDNSRSEIAVPLVHGLGVLNIESPILNAFDGSDSKALGRYAERIAATLPSAATFMEFDVLLQLENEINQQIVGAASKDGYRRLCSLIAQKAQRLVGAEYVQVLSVEDDNEYLRIDFSSYATEADRIRIDNSICGQAILEQGNKNISDVHRDGKYPPMVPGTNSELVVIAREGQRISVAINAESPRLNAFTRHHETLLTLFAQQAGRALRYLRFAVSLERLQAENRATQTLVAIADVMGNVLHALSSDVGVVRYWLENIRKTLQANQETHTALLQIEKGLDHLGSIPERVSVRLGEAEKIVTVELNAIIRATIERVKTGWMIPDGVRLEIDLSGALRIRASVYGLEKVIENLIWNALDAVGPTGAISVRTRLGRAGMLPDHSYAELTIADTGIGISKKMMAKIFDAGFSAKQELGSGGMGFGLFWVKLFLDRFQGEVSVTSEVGRGTTFFVRLPIEGEEKSGKSA